MTNSVLCTRLNPVLLEWARTTLNIDLNVAARRADVSEDALRQFESGESFPTLAQLRRLATFYERPIATFFLPSKPMSTDGPRDFRSNNRPLTRSTLLSVRRARAVQRFTGELVSSATPVFWTHSRDPESAARAAREWLELGEEEQTLGRNARDLFNLLVHKLDRHAIEVLVHRFPKEDAKAYCLADSQQIIVVSSNDSSIGSRNFSVLHELGHLARGVSGLCLTQEAESSFAEERYCDKFAVSFLMPESLILRLVGSQRGADLADSVDDLVQLVKSSKEALLIRFKELGLISENDFQTKMTELRQRTLPRGRGASSRTSNVIKECGLKLPHLVFEAYVGERLSPNDAARILNLNQAYLDDVGSRLGFL